jgi:hypothetical protein
MYYNVYDIQKYRTQKHRGNVQVEQIIFRQELAINSSNEDDTFQQNTGQPHELGENCHPAALNPSTKAEEEKPELPLPLLTHVGILSPRGKG